MPYYGNQITTSNNIQDNYHSEGVKVQSHSSPLHFMTGSRVYDVSQRTRALYIILSCAILWPIIKWFIIFCNNTRTTCNKTIHWHYATLVNNFWALHKSVTLNLKLSFYLWSTPYHDNHHVIAKVWHMRGLTGTPISYNFTVNFCVVIFN